MKKMMLAVVSYFLLVLPVTAQDPPGYAVYFPLVRSAPPSPCDALARSLVLELSDLPGGYQLDEAGQVDLSPEVQALGVADSYQAIYVAPAGIPVMSSAGLVFWTPDGARVYLARIAGLVDADPVMEPVAPPPLGDESLAIHASLWPLADMYVVVVRVHNLVAVVSAGGVPGSVSLGDALGLAARATGRMEGACRPYAP